MKNFIKTVCVFIGLKLLEIWCFISLFVISAYIVLALLDWNWELGILKVIGLAVLYGGCGISCLAVVLVIVLCIVDWLKDNWEWAKEIVSGYEPRKF